MECPRCDGLGWYVVPVCCRGANGLGDFGSCCGNPDPGQEQCAECNGTGAIEQPTTRMLPCPRCSDGADTGEWMCSLCHGAGVVEGETYARTLEDIENEDAYA